LLESLNARCRIKKYYDLVRIANLHYNSSEELARLKESYPQLFDKETVRHEALRQEISSLTVIVHHHLRRINAPLKWSDQYEEAEYDPEKRRNVRKKKTEDYNIITDRLYPVYRGKAITDLEVTYPMLEESIATYNYIWKHYLLNIINPLWLIARILRLPLSLLEYMGVNTETTNVNKFVYWMMQGLVLIILAFISLKLGIDTNISLLRP